MNAPKLWVVVSADGASILYASEEPISKTKLETCNLIHENTAPHQILEYVANPMAIEIDSPHVLPFPGLAKRSPEFLPELLRLASELETDPNYLLTVMQLESGIDPAAQNPNGGATGLIQFMPATAKYLGTSTDVLRKMTDYNQLIYVRKYMIGFKGRLHSAGDVYMTIFYPAFLGKPDTTVISRRGNAIYNANRVLDVNNDGVLTVGDVKRRAETYYAKMAESHG